MKLWPVLLLASCGMLKPSLPSLPGVGGAVASPVASVAKFVEPESLWRFAWLSIILVLFFPKIREPLVSLWTAIFRAIAIPFLLMRAWYESKFGGNDDGD